MNVKHNIKDDTLFLAIDISKKALEAAKASQSGKTKIVATTSGFVQIGDVKYSLNVTCPPTS